MTNTRSQEDRDVIIANISDPYSVENFLSQDEVAELIDIHENKTNRTHKVTGPTTTKIEDDEWENIAVFKNIASRLQEQIGAHEVFGRFYFYVEKPHIIHNDDLNEFPLIYKASTLPLQITYNEPGNTDLPSLCFFDQYYLDGPSKFFKGGINFSEYYNKHVDEYSKVYNTTDTPFDPAIKEKYFSHLKDEWLEGLSFKSALPWKPGNALIFDCARLHAASNFLQNGIKSKLGLAIFTKLP